MAIGSYDREELTELLEDRQFRKLRETMSEMNEVDIAEFIEELEPEKKVLVYRMLPKELAADVFSFLEVDDQEHIINSITDYELGKIVEDLYVDDAVDMLEELPAIVVKRVLQNATPETRNLINQFLQYPENSAGSIMTAEYIGLKRNMTVEQAFAYIRENGVDKETIYTCFVTDSKRCLQGVVTVKDLLMNPYDTIIKDIMDENIIYAVTTEDREDVVETFNKYDLLCLPVVDHEDRLVGIVTVDDAVEVMEQEATEDLRKNGGYVPVREALSSDRRAGACEKPYSLAVNFDVYVDFERRDPDGLPGGDSGASPALKLCPHADGHQWQLRQSEQHHGYPWYGGGRYRTEGRLAGGLEGVPGGTAVRRGTGGSQLYPADFTVSGSTGPESGHRPFPDAGHCAGEDHRLRSADAGRENEAGSGDYGCAPHHHHRGRQQPSDLF